MTDPHTQSSPPPIPPPEVPFRAQGGGPPRTPAKIEPTDGGQAMAVVSYVFNFFSIPFWIAPMVMGDSRFAVFHAKQCMMLWLTALSFGAGISLLALIAGAVTCGVGAFIAVPLAIVLGVGLLVLNIMGLISSINGDAKPLPIIGKLAEEWFRGIQAKQDAR